MHAPANLAMERIESTAVSHGCSLAPRIGVLNWSRDARHQVGQTFAFPQDVLFICVVLAPFTIWFPVCVRERSDLAFYEQMDQISGNFSTRYPFPFVFVFVKRVVTLTRSFWLIWNISIAAHMYADLQDVQRVQEKSIYFLKVPGTLKWCSGVYIIIRNYLVL
jgi:hypothetical protein